MKWPEKIMVVDSNKVFQEVSVKIKNNDRLVFGLLGVMVLLF